MVTELPTNEVVVDLDDGGRWTSLFLGGREWLWSGPGLVSGPREGFTTYIDVGGLDECFPTVRGEPDHGGLWNQPWGSLDEDDEWDVIPYEGAALPGSGPGGEAVLLRRFNGGETPAEVGVEGAIWVDYRLIATPGYRFIWAAHALLDCEVGAVVDVPADTVGRLYPQDGSNWAESGLWSDLELGTYGPTDGTAVGAVLIDCPTASVVDGSAVLTFSLSCPGQPVSTALWRNLGGYPAEAPYRSLGVEPMLGRVFGLAEAGPGDAAVVPASGELTWRLVVSAVTSSSKE
jgi:hypothetical protein